MSAHKLLAQLHELGARVELENDRVRISAPPDALDEKLWSALKAQKAEIHALLKELQQAQESRSPLHRQLRPERLPLSYAQQRLWFLDQLAGSSAEYNMPEGLRLSGELDREALQRALNAIVERHESLRTHFAEVEGEPLQVIASELKIEVPVEDLRGLDEIEQQQAVQDALRKESAQGFDLSRGPLLRVRLLQLGDREHVLLRTMHHIVSDGWSQAVFNQEFRILYEAYREGLENPLKPLAVQYADFALWQRQWLDKGVMEEGLGYWRQRLAGIPGELDLVKDRPRPVAQTFAAELHQMILPSALVPGLKRLSQENQATLYMTLLAGFAVLLSRYSGQDDIVVGSPIANRQDAQLEQLIGFFVNSLVMRIQLHAEMSFREVLQEVRRTALDAYRYQDVPFERLVEELNPQRVLNMAPLYQVIFAWQSIPRVAQELKSLEIQPVRGGEVSARFDLEIYAWESDEEIGLSWVYNRDLFDGWRMEQMARHYVRVLEGMVANAGQSIQELELLPEQERRQVLYGWNETGREYAREKCVYELFEEQAEKTPAATAVVFEEKSLTYGELNTRANRLAHYLRELGVKPDERVGICVERGLEMVIAVLAVLKSGGAYVPLDPGYPAERLSYMVEDSAPVVLLVEGDAGRLLGAIGKNVPVVDVTQTEQWRNQPETNPEAAGMTAQNLAYVIYTSGSTGKPKGVGIEHRNAANFINWGRESFTGKGLEQTLFSTSLNFDLAVYECFVPLSSGATVRIVKDVLEGKRELDATLINTVPSAMRALVEGGRVPAKLRTVNLAGEALKRDLVEEIFAATEVERICNLYGPTETTTYSTWVEMGREDGFAAHVGHPVANTQIYILDGRGKPVPAGVVGEIYIGGAGVARGYLQRPGLTAERFVADPFTGKPGDRMYRTGDLGRWSGEGVIEYLGRSDHQVKIRGFRIELGEIEARLAECAGVKDAVVVAREDMPGEKRLVAYYTGSESSAILVEQLRAQLGKSLPEYMVPAAYVELEAMPLTANGKLDRKALPKPEYVGKEYEAPRGAVEKALAEIWQELLGVERVGRQDNFFELGGHSLLAVRLIERMRRSDIAVDLRTLFGNPTVAGLAEAAGRGEKQKEVEVPPNLLPSGCEVITPEMVTLVELSQQEIDTIVSKVPGGAGNVQDIYPLGPLQEGILFHHVMGGDGDPYLLSVLMAFDSRERLERYVEAMAWVIGRHDILRTGVVWEGVREAVQVVWRQAKLRVQEVILDASTDAEEQMYERFNPRHTRIDVGEAPLLRVYTARDEKKDRWLMLQQLHHLAGDHTTLEVMQEEIAAYLLGRKEELAEPQPFRNLVVQAKLGENVAEQEAFFRKMLGEVEEPTAPFGLLEVQGDGRGIEEARVEVEKNLARRIRSAARRLKVSAASVFHVAWGCVVARTAAREEAVFGTLLFGRMQAGAGSDRVMGLFINTLPVRITVGDEGVEKSLRKTHSLLAELLRHEHTPLVLAQRCSRVAAPAPLFTSLLNYRHSGNARADQQAAAWEGMKWVRVEERTNYPCGLSVDDVGEDFWLTAQTVAEVDPRRVCGMMSTALESLVQALEREPGKVVRELEILPEEERKQVVYGWNKTQREYAKEKCVHELFEEQVERSPEAVAVVYEDQSLSYRVLNARANRLAHYLRKLGVKPDERVGICIGRGLEMMVSVLGVLKAGGAYVPLDPGYPAERLHYMVEDSGPLALLVNGDAGKILDGIGKKVTTVDLTQAEAWKNLPETNPETEGLTSQHLAYVIYTSGSTGKPKGVEIEHRNAVNFVLWGQDGFAGKGLEQTLFSTSLNFDLAVYECFVPLASGGTVRIVRDVLEGGSNLDVTLINTVPSAMRALVEGRRVPAKLRTVNLAGEALKRELVEKIFAETEVERICNLYGPTETTTYSTWVEMSRAEGFAAHVGHPVANTQIYILDGRGKPVPAGVVGEIYIGGAGVARGYLKRPGLTAEKFLADPFSGDPGARMYRTGDLGRWLPDGSIEFLGRSDFQVKIRGFRIELGEIEAVLCSHEQVREAVVTVEEDQSGGKRLLAHVVLVSGDNLHANTLRQWLAQRLASYMLPSDFIQLEALPLTANGKIDRKALRQTGTLLGSDGAFVPPQDTLQKAITGIWQEVLGRQEISIFDNFFELGGHSLLAIRAYDALRRLSNAPLSMIDLFRYPTVATLAQYMADGKRPHFQEEEQTRRIRGDERRKEIANRRAMIKSAD